MRSQDQSRGKTTRKCQPHVHTKLQNHEIAQHILENQVSTPHQSPLEILRDKVYFNRIFIIFFVLTLRQLFFFFFFLFFFVLFVFFFFFSVSLLFFVVPKKLLIKRNLFVDLVLQGSHHSHKVLPLHINTFDLSHRNTRGLTRRVSQQRNLSKIVSCKQIILRTDAKKKDKCSLLPSPSKPTSPSRSPTRCNTRTWPETIKKKL